MAEIIRTKIYKLRYDPDVSDHIGYLGSQQRLAYNWAVDVLNEFPDIPLWASEARRDNLCTRVRDWISTDHRPDAPVALLKAGTQQAWRENDVKLRQHRLDALREQEGSEAKQGSRPTLDHRSRKHGPATLISQMPPARIEGTEDKFRFPGRKNVILQTAEPVPKDLNIISFKLVEVRQECRGVNGQLRKRRYALHLDVSVTNSEPIALDAVETPRDVLGLVDSARKRVAMSDGDVIDTDDSKAKWKEQKQRRTASHKKLGSKRQQKVLSKVRKSEKRRRANRKRLTLQRVRELYKLKRPMVVAVAPTSYRAKMRPLKRNATSPTKRFGPQIEPALSESMQVIVAEAQRQGIRIYSLLPPNLESCGSIECRHRTYRESQVAVRCRRCSSETNADVSAALKLQQRAFECIRSSTGRPMHKGDTPTGRQVNPSRDARNNPCLTQGAANPKSGRGQRGVGSELLSPEGLPGVSLQAGSTREQGAQRQLVSPTSDQHIITDELFYLFDRITDKDCTATEKRNTAKGLANWVTWAIVNGHQAIPADTGKVASFLSIRAELGCRPSTLRHYARAIARYHKVLGLEDPITDNIERLIKDIQKKVGRNGKQAQGLDSKQISIVEGKVFTPTRIETTYETRLRGLKVIALLNIMHDCLLRLGEAVNLVWGDFSVHEDGSGLVIIRKSKTDPYGIGTPLYVTPETVQALLAIRDGAKDDESIFGWNEKQMSYRLKQVMKFAGLDKGYSSHSLRRGMAQELARENFTMDDIKEVGRWKSDSMVIHYAMPNDSRGGTVAQLYQEPAGRTEDCEQGDEEQFRSECINGVSKLTDILQEEASHDSSPVKNAVKVRAENPQELGALIRLRRKELGMSQKQLAKVIGVNDGAVSSWELGRVFPMPFRMERLAQALGWSAIEIC